MNLNPSVSRKEHRELMILHANLMLPRPWNPMEREDLGSRVWVRVRGEESSGSSWLW